MSKIKGTTKSGGQKHALDKFYTKPEIATLCINFTDLTQYETIIEPSAGNGAFSSQILNCEAYDLEPENLNIVKQDWFTYVGTRKPGKTLVIGNPPFGQQNSLAVKFINHSAEFADTIAFILPISFKKPSIQSRINPHLHLMKEVILPANSFTLNGEDYNVPSIFQIWEYRPTVRLTVKPVLTSKFYDFVKPDIPHDFRIIRVGGRAGYASQETQPVNSETNYFIKLKTVIPVDVLTAEINKIVFTGRDFGVGPRTISKPELIAELDKVVKKLLKNCYK